MNKEGLLQELSAKINSGEISREEIARELELTQPNQLKPENNGETKKIPRFSVTKVLYILGAAIVIFGIIIFVAQVWSDVASFGRIAVTLGLGLLIAAIGSMLLRQKPNDNIGPIFHFIGGVLIPGGSLVTLFELGIDSEWTVAITFVGIFAFYLTLSAIHKHAILTFFAIINGTTAVYLIFNAVVGGPYLNMTTGASYLLLSQAFRGGWNKPLISALHFFGSAVFLGATFVQVFDSFSWQLLYFPIVFAGLFLSIYMKSRSILAISTFFLLAHVSYITSEYFANSLGWPISLVILGFIFIGLGYASVAINKRYIKNVN